jgi:hypothetical protein
MVIGPRFRDLDEVIRSLGAQEQAFIAARDRRAVFLTVYTMTSLAMKRRIAERRFLDPDWVTRSTISFAHLYRDALDAFLSGCYANACSSTC